MARAFLAASYAWLGDITGASAHIARLRELDPNLALGPFLATMHYAREEDLMHLKEGLQKAGW